MAVLLHITIKPKEVPFMRGIPSLITDIRKKVFTEVARMAYEDGGFSRVEDLPYVIVPGENPLHRESIFLERAIAKERVRLAMGLSIRPVQTRTLMTEGMDHAAIAEQYYEPPLINIIPYACHACPTKQYRVTENCQNCLAASCQKVCPKGAISFANSKSRIDPEKCIKCGKCAKACPYNAIIYMERPCVAACGVDAIGTDSQGRAVIDQDKCVACGQCLVSCPFGAIVDKGQIFQVIRSIMQKDQVIAIVAPAFIGQFGKHSTPEKFTAAMKQLGFDQVVEVAVGADMCTIEEAKDFLEKVPAQQDFMATSCCPAWHSMVEKLFPDQFPNISMTLTPMVFTARLVKKEHPGCKVVFVGPCAAKKLEAIRENIRSDVDFVLTFEELQGMFAAKDIDFATIPEGEPMREGTAAGRGFAVSGGVAGAVKDLIHQTHPDLEIKTAGAEGLRECRKLMTLAKAGKYKGYLLEGMACPGGCVAGAGTLLPIDLAAAVVGRYQKEADQESPMSSKYRDVGEHLD
jgi:[FeFe] hydrogenase (group B1/B3)